MSNEYGSDEYYEETGKNGTTINTKKTEGLPAYDKKLFYLDSFFKRMVYSNYNRSIATYSNFYYKDNDGKIYYWHRKRKGEYTISFNQSSIYLDGKAMAFRKRDSLLVRKSIFCGMIQNKAYYIVHGSSKFDDNENAYLARSEDGTLIEPILNIHEQYSNSKWERYKPDNVGRIGMFYDVIWHKEGDEDISEYFQRHRIFCYKYNGKDYTVDIIAEDLYSDPPELVDSEGTYYSYICKGYLSYLSEYFPIVAFRWLTNRTSRYVDSENKNYFVSKWSASWRYGVDYLLYKLYNAVNGSFIDVPFINDCEWLVARMNYGSGYVNEVVDVCNWSVGFLKTVCIVPVIKLLGTCPNGNSLICITYDCDIYSYGDTQTYPEYRNFVDFYHTPQYYVIDYGSAKINKSNIKESKGYYIPRYNGNLDTERLPQEMYTDSEYLWFYRKYRNGSDIEICGTKDGYNIDKRYTYYNRTTIPATFHSLYNGHTNDVDMSTFYAKAVPVFKNGVFEKYLVRVSINSDGSGGNGSGIVNDLKPNSNGRLDIFFAHNAHSSSDNDSFEIEQDCKQPGQTDDDYIYEIE